MKTLLIGFLILMSVSAFAKLSDLCVAQRVDMISYASTIHYHVNCKSEQFDTRKSLIAAALPLPYNWNAVARKDLATLMNSKGYLEAAKINEVTEVREFKYGFNQTGREVISLAFGKPVIVFSKSQKTRNICAVVQSNQHLCGISTRTSVFDFTISCNQGPVRDHLSGITKQEFNEYMKKLGTEFATSTTYLGNERSGTLLVYEEQI